MPNLCWKRQYDIHIPHLTLILLQSHPPLTLRPRHHLASPRPFSICKRRWLSPDRCCHWGCTLHAKMNRSALHSFTNFKYMTGAGGSPTATVVLFLRKNEQSLRSFVMLSVSHIFGFPSWTACFVVWSLTLPLAAACDPALTSLSLAIPLICSVTMYSGRASAVTKWMKAGRLFLRFT